MNSNPDYKYTDMERAEMQQAADMQAAEDIMEDKILGRKAEAEVQYEHHYGELARLIELQKELIINLEATIATLRELREYDRRRVAELEKEIHGFCNK
jgi:hypothetical protein